MRARLVVLCVQDTTELDLNGQGGKGLGPLNYEARRGMYVHPTWRLHRNASRSAYSTLG